MSNLHRIQWIDLHIRSHRFPNCTDIAREFCLSRRQASRDIEYLRYSLGAPVEFSPEKNGYYYTDESFILPAVMIGRDEKQALSYLAEQYRAASGQLAGQLADLFERLSGKPRAAGPGVADLPVYRVTGSLLTVIRTLEQALIERKKVLLHYVNTGQVRSRRIIHPLEIFILRDIHYLTAYCETKAAERVFRLGRIRSIEVLEQIFTIPGWFKPGRYRDRRSFNFRLPYTARVCFDRPVTPPAAGSTFIMQEQNIYRITFTKSEQLFSELISLGTGFSILSPGWLKQKCYIYFSKILEKNRQ